MWPFGSTDTNPDIFDAYHEWYYDSDVWQRTSFLGLKSQKSVMDLWNYQEIISELKPSLIIESGTGAGGSTLFFSTVLKAVNEKSQVISFDIHDQSKMPEPVKNNPHILLLNGRLTGGHLLAAFIGGCRVGYPGPWFVILDDDHTKKNVLEEMQVLRPILKKGDYLVVEDGNINGHPVYPRFGAGPTEAIEEYFRMYPDDYVRDLPREKKFGFTFAPSGYLIRQGTR